MNSIENYCDVKDSACSNDLKDKFNLISLSMIATQEKIANDPLDVCDEDTKKNSIKSLQHQSSRLESRNQQDSDNYDLLHHDIDNKHCQTDSLTVCSNGIKRPYIADDEKGETVAKKCLLDDYNNFVDSKNFVGFDLEHPTALPLLFSLTSESETQDVSNSTETCRSRGTIPALESRCNNTSENLSSENSREIFEVREFFDESICEKFVKPAFCESLSKILNANVNTKIYSHSLTNVGHDRVNCNSYNVPTCSFNDNNEKNNKNVNNTNSFQRVSLDTDDGPSVSLSHTCNPCTSISASSFLRLPPEISPSAVTIPCPAVSSDLAVIELCPERLSVLAAVVPEHSQSNEEHSSTTMDGQTDILCNSISCVNFRFIDNTNCALNENISFPNNSHAPKRDTSCADVSRCHETLFGDTLNSSHKHEYLVKSTFTNENRTSESFPFRDICRDNDNKEDNDNVFDPIISDNNIYVSANMSELRPDSLPVDQHVVSSNETISKRKSTPDPELEPSVIDSMSEQVEERSNESVKLFNENYLATPLELVSKDDVGAFLTKVRASQREMIIDENLLNLVIPGIVNIPSYLKDKDMWALTSTIENELKLRVNVCDDLVPLLKVKQEENQSLKIVTNEISVSCPAEVINLKVKFEQSIGDLLNCVEKLDASQENNQEKVKSETHKVLTSSVDIGANLLVIEPRVQLTVTGDKKSDLSVLNVLNSSQQLPTASLCGDRNVNKQHSSATSVYELTDNVVDSDDSTCTRVFWNINPEAITSSSSNCASTVINVITKKFSHDAHMLSKNRFNTDLTEHAINSPKESHKQHVQSSMPSSTSGRTSSSRPMGKLLMDLGLQLVSKQVFRALISIQKRNLRKNNDITGQSRQLLAKLESTRRGLVATNLPYRCGQMLRCRCDFGANSANVLEHHREYGEEIGYGCYRCCYCKDGDEGDEDFRSPTHLQRHMEAEHDRTYRPTHRWHHRCYYCPYVHNTLSTMLMHRRKCERLFNLARNLEPNQDDADIPIVVGNLSEKNPSSVNSPMSEVVRVSESPKEQPIKNISVRPPSVPSGPANTKVPDYVLSQRIRFENPWRFGAQNYNPTDFLFPSVRTNGAPNLIYQGPRVPLQSLLRSPNFSCPIPGLSPVFEGTNNFNFQIHKSLMNPHCTPNFNYGVRETMPINLGAPNFNYQMPGLSPAQFGESLPLLMRYMSSLQSGVQPVFGGLGGLSFPNSVSLSNNGGYPVGPRFLVSSASSGSPDMSFQRHPFRTTISNQFCRPDRLISSPNQLTSMQMCPICQGFVQDSAVMAVHLRLCHPMIGQQLPQAPIPDQASPPVFCFTCTPPAPFLNQSLLQQHQSMLHSTKRADVISVASTTAQTMCWFCSTPVVASLIEHMESKHQLTLWIMLKRRMCYLCPEQLVDVSAFENHMLIVHARLFPALDRLWSSIQDSIPLAELQASGLDIDVGQFGESKCPNCKDVFLNRSFLHRHFFLNHGMNAGTKLPHANRPTMPTKMIKCPLCRLSVIEGDYYYRHLKRVHTRSCSVSITRLDKKTFKRYHTQYVTQSLSSLGDGSVTNNVTSDGDKSVAHNLSRGSPDNSVELLTVETCSLKIRLDLRKIERETNECLAFDKEREAKNSPKRCSSDQRVKYVQISDLTDQQIDSSMPGMKLCSPSVNQISDSNIHLSPRRKRPKRDNLPLIISDDETEEEITEASVLKSLPLERDVDSDRFRVTRGSATASNSKTTNKKKSSRTRSSPRSKDISEDYSISPLVIEPENINFNTLEMSTSEFSIQDVESRSTKDDLGRSTDRQMVVLNENDSD